MNQITTLQNEKRSLQLLAAQRQLYARAKRLLGWQVLVSGPVATAAAVTAILVPDTRDFIAALAITVVILDVVWLTPWQKRLRESAARMQERFDCDVLGLKWDSTRAGNPEPAEEVLENAMAYQTWAAKMSTLQNWYPAAVNQLPLSLARLVCQRTNAWWDAKQRRRYASVMGSLVLITILGVCWAAVGAKLSVRELFLAVVVPLLPTLKLGFQQWTEHREAADRLDRLRERTDRLWKDALTKPNDPGLESESRALQGEIFDGRKRNPLVFDFVFKRLRADYETQMCFGAEQLVDEAVNALGLRASPSTAQV